MYNVTWRNERTVEIPIVWKIVESFSGNILEVGNVLSHYFKVNHDIVDKYEKALGVINEDVTEISASKKYDLIISISTLEHVGWDENPAHDELADDPEKILKALSKMCKLLKPKGKIVITIPLGYNPHLDGLLKSGRLRFDKQMFVKRATRTGKWVEARWEEVKDARFNTRVPTANAIMIGVLENCA